jgi:SAM-dependent methyltransferase
MAFVRAGEGVHAVVFDLPSVIPLTKGYVERAGLTERIGFREGDMMTDDLGSGYDLILLSAICHMNSMRENDELFEKCLRALAPGGRIVIQDFVLDPDKTSPRTAVMFALNMLVGTRAGGTYSDQEYFDSLKRMGFENPTRLRLHGPTGLIIAVKP